MSSQRVSEVSESRGRGSLGSEHVTTEFTTARHPDVAEPLKIWPRDDKVRLIEVSYPGVEDAQRVLSSKLGEPEAKLDYYQRTLLYERSAYVYPERGAGSITPSSPAAGFPSASSERML